ncbi:MAG: hypothetical protein R3Y11_08535 [Pseudomonadota bacterium]
MSEDIRLNVDFFTHHKTRRLRRKLGADAVLSLITLFCYVGKTRPEGALLGMDADDIADVSDWDGDAQDFVSELCSIGFLEQCEEGIYHVHEWDEHNPWAAEQTERSDKARNAANKRWDKVRADNAKSQAEHTSSNAHNNNELCSNDANAMLEQCKGNANAVPTQCPSAPLPFPKEVYSPHLTPPLGPPLAPPSPPLREPCADFMELREFYSSTCREEGANVGYAEFVQAVKSRDLVGGVGVLMASVDDWVKAGAFAGPNGPCQFAPSLKRFIAEQYWKRKPVAKPVPKKNKSPSGKARAGAKLDGETLTERNVQNAQKAIELVLAKRKG